MCINKVKLNVGIKRSQKVLSCTIKKDSELHELQLNEQSIIATTLKCSFSDTLKSVIALGGSFLFFLRGKAIGFGTR